MLVDLPLSVPAGALRGVPAAARAAEMDGFSGVSYSEMTSDPLLHLTIAAGVTSRVDLITNIIVAFARSPMTLAVQGRAIQDYSGGRLILGLGSQIKPHIERRFSMPWSAPVARMVEFVAAMEAIWDSWATGTALNYHGDFYSHTLMTPLFVPPSEFPAPRIFLAAVGERMAEAAGAVAGGLIVHPFSTERYLREVTLPAVSRGRSRATRSAGGFEVVSGAFIVTGRTAEAMARSSSIVRRQIAFYGSTAAYRPVLELHGWGELADELNRLARTSDPGRWTEMGELINDEVLAAFAVVGEPETVEAQFRARYGDVIDRYELNDLGIGDTELAREIACGLQGSTGVGTRPSR